MNANDRDQLQWQNNEKLTQTVILSLILHISFDIGEILISQ